MPGVRVGGECDYKKVTEQFYILTVVMNILIYPRDNVSWN